MSGQQHLAQSLGGFPLCAPKYSDDIGVTPTGACLVAELATERAVAWPGDGFVPERVGYGAGGRDLADRANVFMAVLGRREPGRERRASSSSSEAGGAHSIGHYTHALGPDAEANGGGHSHGHDHNHSH